MEYNELVKLVSGIPDFKKMVASESKRPIAVRLLMSVAEIDKHSAWEFVNELYSNMDIKMNSRMIGDKIKTHNLNR